MQARERERLCLTPVDAAVGAERLPAALELACELRVDREAVGDGQQPLVQVVEHVRADGGGRYSAVNAVALRRVGRRRL